MVPNIALVESANLMMYTVLLAGKNTLIEFYQILTLKLV
jgi:hypothetical protein